MIWYILPSSNLELQYSLKKKLRRFIEPQKIFIREVEGES
jgi:hypothetical protein